jgi:hypothetical protein
VRVAGARRLAMVIAQVRRDSVGHRRSGDGRHTVRRDRSISPRHG